MCLEYNKLKAVVFAEHCNNFKGYQVRCVNFITKFQNFNLSVMHFQLWTFLPTTNQIYHNVTQRCLSFRDDLRKKTRTAIAETCVTNKTRQKWFLDNFRNMKNIESFARTKKPLKKMETSRGARRTKVTRNVNDVKTSKKRKTFKKQKF